MGEMDSSVTFLATTPDDIRFWASFRKDMPKGVTFLEDLRSPSEIAKEISQSDFIVSSRMHPIILGSLSDTPFFAIGWEYKLDELNTALCTKGCCVHASKLDDSVDEVIIERMKKADELSKDISRNTLLLRKKTFENLEILRTNLRSWGFDLE
jgi:polysaccharide pyruvyl transferase WcaK-like protein